MTYVITEPCIGIKDQSCVEVCPVDCIYDGGDQFFINPEECIDCGACEPECPVEAIYPEDEVPEEMESYIAKNVDFFEYLHQSRFNQGRGRSFGLSLFSQDPELRRIRLPRTRVNKLVAALAWGFIPVG